MFQKSFHPRQFSFPAFFCLVLLVNFFVWGYSHDKLPQWSNVPPAPSELSVSAAFLGDKELAYRTSALFLQNFGNSTGQVQALKDYNFDYLHDWFFLSDRLNKNSDSVPFLAAYYYGATQNVDQLRPVIDYLRVVGTYPEGDKWRWLGHAVFLAKHRLKDQNLALQLAQELSDTYRSGMPAWPLQMKAIVASDMGDKELAYGMMLEVLKSSVDSMHPNEVNFMVDYICNTILTPVQKAGDVLCDGQ